MLRMLIGIRSLRWLLLKELFQTIANWMAWVFLRTLLSMADTNVYVPINLLISAPCWETGVCHEHKCSWSWRLLITAPCCGFYSGAILTCSVYQQLRSLVLNLLPRWSCGRVVPWVRGNLVSRDAMLLQRS